MYIYRYVCIYTHIYICVCALYITCLLTCVCVCLCVCICLSVLACTHHLQHCFGRRTASCVAEMSELLSRPPDLTFKWKLRARLQESCRASGGLGTNRALKALLPYTCLLAAPSESRADRRVLSANRHGATVGEDLRGNDKLPDISRLWALWLAALPWPARYYTILYYVLLYCIILWYIIYYTPLKNHQIAAESHAPPARVGACVPWQPPGPMP